MKPEKKAYQIEYWGCNHPDHHHTTEDIAQRCITKDMTTKKLEPKYFRQLRKLNVIRDLINGLTRKEAAEKHGVSILMISAYIDEIGWLMYNTRSIENHNLFRDMMEEEGVWPDGKTIPHMKEHKKLYFRMFEIMEATWLKEHIRRTK